MQKKNLSRRQFSLLAGAAFAAPAIISGRGASAAGARVVVIGGGFGGATAARYLKRWDSSLDVTLVEPSSTFVTCPFSNLVLGGLKQIGDITHGYDGLTGAGITVVHEKAELINTERRWVLLPGEKLLKYDRLIVSPGIDFRWNAIEGYDEAATQHAPHAWKAGDQTMLLLEQLRAQLSQEHDPPLRATIETRIGDMKRPQLPLSAFDLVWSEGALYNLGIERGLATCGSILRARSGIAAKSATKLCG